MSLARRTIYLLPLYALGFLSIDSSGPVTAQPLGVVTNPEFISSPAISELPNDADDPPWQREGRPMDRRVYKARIAATWLGNDSHFWYRNELPGGRREYILVDAEQRVRAPAFDHARLATALVEAGVKDASPDRLALERLEFNLADKTMVFRIGDANWLCQLDSFQLEKIDRPLTDRTDEQRRRALQGGPRASLRTGADTELTFLNRTNGEIELFWLDSGGERRSYGKVPAEGERAQHTFVGHVWEIVDSEGTTLDIVEAEENASRIEILKPQGRVRRPGVRIRGGMLRGQSPDGHWDAFVRDHNVFVRSRQGGEEIALSHDGLPDHGYEMVQWSPDSKTVIAFRVEPAEQKQVHLVESSPSGGGRARLHSRNYPLPGDKFATFELNLFDVTERKQTKPEVERIDFGFPRIRWGQDSRRFTYEKTDRGHQQFRVIEVDAATGSSRTLIREATETFIWTAHAENMGIPKVTWLEKSAEIIFTTEQDGWRHLYLLNAETGEMKNPITAGNYVVRGVDRIDEESRQIWFRASGRNPDQDPYFIHYYRINFDGSGLVALTDGNGNHTIQYSPDRKYFVDTYSRVDLAPVHELRRSSDGTKVCGLESADISELEASGWKAPEVFTAKGRDGVTDIWGIICRPRNFDPATKYPILEDIYAGPQGSFVPKTFSAAPWYSSFTDLGFVVVKMDGMGTANRSKAFHDQCWKNLKDAGFPDRINWIRAAAAKYPQLDLDRVGIYGRSAVCGRSVKAKESGPAAAFVARSCRWGSIPTRNDLLDRSFQPG